MTTSAIRSGSNSAQRLCSQTGRLVPYRWLLGATLRSSPPHALDVHLDGKKTDRWGSNPKGIFIFDAHGHFAQFITRSDLPKFAAGRKRHGGGVGMRPTATWGRSISKTLTRVPPCVRLS